MEVTQPHEAWRLNLIGVPGEGKSEYRSRLLAPVYRVTLYNPMEDYQIGEVVSVDEYRQRIASSRRDALRVTVRPSTWDPIGMSEEYDALCSYVFEIGAMHFSTEEQGLAAPPSYKDRMPGLNRLWIAGRHRKVSLSAIGQRFHQFPLIVRGTASEIVAFRQTDPDDVRDFNRRIAPDIAPVPVNQLPEHHFLRWSPAVGVQLRAPLSMRRHDLKSAILDTGMRRNYSLEDRLEESGNPAA